jgi:hypothetical protein
LNEVWLHIGVEPNGARLVIKQVTGSPGVGSARLTFLGEATAKKASAVGCPLLFNAHIEALGARRIINVYSQLL